MTHERIPGTRALGHRLGQAQLDFEEVIRDISGVTNKESREIFDYYHKHKIIKYSGGRYSVKHGAYLDPDTLRKALVQRPGLKRNGSKSLGNAIKIREDFYDKPHKKQQQVNWAWPAEMVEVGDCEAILYTSNKWQKDGKMIDYKHVKEGDQKLMLRSDVALTGDADEMFGPVVDMRNEFPDSFAVLAQSISIQARLYSDDSGKKYGDYVDLKFKGSKLGAGKFDDGSSFCFVYDKSGVLAVVVGEKLDVLKDGIVG